MSRHSIIVVALFTGAALCGCSEELTREKAGAIIKSELESTVPVVKITTGELLTDDESFNYYKLLIANNFLDIGNCRRGTPSNYTKEREYCFVRISQKSSKYADDHKGKRLVVSQIVFGKCQTNCDESFLTVGRFQFGSVTGIAELGIGRKGVQYTFGSSETEVAEAVRATPFGLSFDGLLQQAIFRKFDDGWRLESPLAR
jgi:hypothetical protein